MDPITKEEVEAYVKETFPEGVGKNGYRKNLVEFLLKNVGRPVLSTYLLLIPGKTKTEQNHKHRRWEEVRSLDRLPFVNRNDPRAKDLKPEEWILLSGEPVEKVTRTIGKKIVSQVFERDHSTCRRCGAKAGEDHHLFPGTIVKLHVGHIVPFIHEDPKKKQTVKDFMTLCSMCNEGEQARTLDTPKKIEMIEEQIRLLQKQLESLRASLPEESKTDTELHSLTDDRLKKRTLER